MPSTSAPSEAAPVAARVWHYDGMSGVRREPLLVVRGDGFVLSDLQGDTGPFAFADLRARDADGGDAIFGLRNVDGWRIGFPGGVPAALAPYLPRATRYGAVIDRVGLWPAVAISTVLAACAIALFLMTPAAVSRAVPPSFERRLGDLMVGDYGGRACNAPAGAAALSALVERIAPGDRDVDVQVVNLAIVNAAALPGGHIVVNEGLLKVARSPDELAGVIGHEMGHVRHRDVLESLLRHVGLSVLLGGLDGHVGGYTDALLSSAYSRDAERRADEFSIDTLARANVSTLPTARFFQRLSKLEGPEPGIQSYFASHPGSRDRAARFVAAQRTHRADTPALDPAAWQQLRAICRDDKDVRRSGFRF